jgi:hypothetical protein
MLTFSILAILLPIAIMFHVTEEFLFPGGFIEWYAVEDIIIITTKKGITIK